MDWMLIVKVLGPVVVAIACMMELYKKKIRKDRSNRLEIQVVALLFSITLTAIGYFAFSLPGGLLAILYYTTGVYIAQCYVDMRIVKRFAKAWLNRKGVNLDGYKWDE